MRDKIEITKHDARPELHAVNDTVWLSVGTDGAEITLFLPSDAAFLDSMARKFANAAEIARAASTIRDQQRRMAEIV